MTSTLLAVVATLLVVSVVLNVLQYAHRRHFEDHWLSRETRALDRAHAAELRAGEQIDAMLDRVSKRDNLSLESAVPQLPPLAEDKPYISDFEYDDERWNELHPDPDADPDA
jgi:hypothetical protein